MLAISSLLLDRQKGIRPPIAAPAKAASADKYAESIFPYSFLEHEPQRFFRKEARERSKISVICLAMTPRPIPFLTDDPKPATWSVDTRLR